MSFIYMNSTKINHMLSIVQGNSYTYFCYINIMDFNIHKSDFEERHLNLDNKMYNNLTVIRINSNYHHILIVYEIFYFNKMILNPDNIQCYRKYIYLILCSINYNNHRNHKMKVNLCIEKLQKLLFN